MGITEACFNSHCKPYFDKATNILELGAQHYIQDGRVVGYFKNIFNQYNITSLDITGENRSTIIDLSKPIVSIQQRYELISNFGTSEHVSSQYQCWKNMHSLLDINGIVISEIPEKFSWKGHCKYYIDYAFFKSMSSDFDIIDYRSIYYQDNGYLSFSILRKKSQIFQTSEHDLLNTINVEDMNDRISY
jgi:hypothetical protein